MVFSPLSGWSSDCLLGFHLVVPEPLHECEVRDSAAWVLGPFRNALRLAKGLYDTVVAGVSGLYQRGCEAAVDWLVVPIVVPTVKCTRFVVWLCQGPGLEQLIRMPLSTQRDSTTAIPSVGMVSGIQASTLHVAPDVVQAAVLHPPLGAGFRAVDLGRPPFLPNGATAALAGICHTLSPFKVLRGLVGKLASELASFRTGCTALPYPAQIINQRSV